MSPAKSPSRRRSRGYSAVQGPLASHMGSYPVLTKATGSSTSGRSDFTYGVFHCSLEIKFSEFVTTNTDLSQTFTLQSVRNRDDPEFAIQHGLRLHQPVQFRRLGHTATQISVVHNSGVSNSDDVTSVCDITMCIMSSVSVIVSCQDIGLWTLCCSGCSRPTSTATTSPKAMTSTGTFPTRRSAQRDRRSANQKGSSFFLPPCLRLVQLLYFYISVYKHKSVFSHKEY